MISRCFSKIKVSKSLKKGRILLRKITKRPRNFQLREKRKLKVKIKKETCYGKILDFWGIIVYNLHSIWNVYEHYWTKESFQVRKLLMLSAHYLRFLPLFMFSFYQKIRNRFPLFNFSLKKKQTWFLELQRSTSRQQFNWFFLYIITKK